LDHYGEQNSEIVYGRTTGVAMNLKAEGHPIDRSLVTHHRVGFGNL